MGIDLHLNSGNGGGDNNAPGSKSLATAVALKAGDTPDALPKIIASGRGMLAEQILQLAFDNNVKVRQDSDLAQLLATLDIDHDIPAEAIVAVAEILARVFEANAAMAKPGLSQSGAT